MADELVQLRAMREVRCLACRVAFPGTGIDDHEESAGHRFAVQQSRIESAIRKVDPEHRPCPGPVALLPGNPLVS